MNSFKTRISDDGSLLVTVNDEDVLSISSTGDVTLMQLTGTGSRFCKINTDGTIFPGPVVLSDTEYNPTNTGDWTIPVPTDVQQALDRIAAALSSLNIKP